MPTADVLGGMGRGGLRLDTHRPGQSGGPAILVCPAGTAGRRHLDPHIAIEDSCLTAPPTTTRPW